MGKKIDLQVYFPHRFSPQKKIVPTVKNLFIDEPFLFKNGSKGFYMGRIMCMCFGEEGWVFAYIYSICSNKKLHNISPE